MLWYSIPELGSLFPSQEHDFIPSHVLSIDLRLIFLILARFYRFLPAGICPLQSPEITVFEPPGRPGPGPPNCPLLLSKACLNFWGGGGSVFRGILPVPDQRKSRGRPLYTAPKSRAPNQPFSDPPKPLILARI